MRKILLLLALLLLSGYSFADCGLTTPNASFGTSVTTFVANTSPSTTSVTTNVNCGGSGGLSLASGDYVSYNFSTASNLSGTRATLKPTGVTTTDNIPIRMCIDANCATELTSGLTYTWSAALLGLGNSLNFALPLYFTTTTGQTVAAGTYTTTITLLVSYKICVGTSALGICLGTTQTQLNVPKTFTVTLILTNDCTSITAPNVSFGSAPLVGNFPTIQQVITLVCSKGSTYTVGLSNGSYYSGTTRQMASGTNRLAYDIYKGTTTTTRWGPSGTDRWSSAVSTTNPDVLTRTFSYTAQILTTQSTPAAGNYTDSVVVDVAF
ncbi:spore coat protein U domain-containing protein [Candidatus Pantoea formicae]|uniref:Csu type fimbrial protein n=1 Tax=Candidatus Pantoea formicae TaxID=2608355 RepID=UPI003EDA1552